MTQHSPICLFITREANKERSSKKWPRFLAEWNWRELADELRTVPLMSRKCDDWWHDRALSTPMTLSRLTVSFNLFSLNSFMPPLICLFTLKQFPIIIPSGYVSSHRILRILKKKWMNISDRLQLKRFIRRRYKYFVFKQYRILTHRRVVNETKKDDRREISQEKKNSSRSRLLEIRSPPRELWKWKLKHIRNKRFPLLFRPIYPKWIV